MSDARLNSVHLESPRRQEFRVARELLLHGRGNDTIAAEHHHLAALSGDSPTAIQKQAANPPPPLARFVLMDSEYVYPLKVGLNTIGRLPDNDVVLQDAFVSRRHCAVLVHLTGDRCELHDIASKNGTLLNGAKINGPTHLKPGDEIRMCDRNLVFLARTEASEADGQHTHAE